MPNPSATAAKFGGQPGNPTPTSPVQTECARVITSRPKQKWGREKDLNLRPRAYETLALPLRHPDKNWSRKRDSNTRPIDYRSIALPSELFLDGAAPGTRAPLSSLPRMRIAIYPCTAKSWSRRAVTIRRLSVTSALFSRLKYFGMEPPAGIEPTPVDYKTTDLPINRQRLERRRPTVVTTTPMGELGGFEPPFPAAWSGRWNSNPRLNLGKAGYWPLYDARKTWSGCSVHDPKSSVWKTEALPSDDIRISLSCYPIFKRAIRPNCCLADD